MSSATRKMTKRAANTTLEQYEEYINLLEQDDIFRTGIINPTVPENYIQKKWEELTIKLNSKGKGPQLNTDKWIQRFSDWKNSTRFKYRKYLGKKNQTGGGPEVKNPLSIIEERAITAWGRVVVEGSSRIPEISGNVIDDVGAITEINSEIQGEIIDDDRTNLSENCIIENIEIIIDGQTDSEVGTQNTTSAVTQKTAFAYSRPYFTKSRKRTNARPRTLNTLVEKLLEHMKENIVPQKKLVDAVNELADTQKELLRFKVAAFRYKNIDFDFQHNYE